MLEVSDVLLKWRNGGLHVGYDLMRDGYGVTLMWNRREDLNDPPPVGEIIFADERRLIWYRGEWRPTWYRYSMPWKMTSH